MGAVQELWHDLREAARMPGVTIDLRLRDAAGNDPFYADLTRRFYAETRARNRRLPVLRAWRYGVAVCPLPPDRDTYLADIEAAGRRNVKKALRLGYRFERIRHNDHLAGLQAIHASAAVRQGRMPDALLHGEVKPCLDPPSRTNVHDYPYFGVLRGETLAAYAGVFACGEAFMIEQVYGHAAHQADGVVPLLLVEMVGYARANYPHAKYFVYDMFFGAGATLRRFKTKFGFRPHKVTWQLGGGA